MPVFINEVIAEVPAAPVPDTHSQAPQQQTTLPPSEYELLQTLNIIEERRQRLLFD